MDDLSGFLAEIREAGGIKAMMRAKGLRAGRCTCPRCKVSGACVAKLAGPRDHLHMSCTACAFRMME